MPKPQRKRMQDYAVLNSSRSVALRRLQNTLLNKPDSPRLLVLEGARGIGKTFLVRLALERTQPHDAVVCSAMQESLAVPEGMRDWLGRHKVIDGGCVIVDDFDRLPSVTQELFWQSLLKEVLRRSWRVILVSAQPYNTMSRTIQGAFPAQVLRLAPLDADSLFRLWAVTCPEMGKSIEKYSARIRQLCDHFKSPRELLHAAALLHDISDTDMTAEEWAKLVKLVQDAPSSDQRLMIRAYVPEFAPEDKVAEELVELYRSLNALHIAMGGNGLLLDGWRMLITDSELVEV